MRIYFAILVCCYLSMAQAEPVTIKHNLLTLRGDLRMPSPDAPLVLLVHGTLAHHEMELIATLQDLLEERDVNSLAITLSLGISNRQGMFDCKYPHSHTNDSALAEIEKWLGWLESRGVSNITLLGHSRGGNRVARYITSRQSTLINKLILLAPATTDNQKLASSYEMRHGKRLADLLEKARSVDTTAWLPTVGFMYCENTDVQAGTFLSYYDKSHGHDTIRLVTDISQPTLIIMGTEDNITQGLAERLNKLSLNHISSVTIDGAGHFFRDLFADEVVDHIQAFGD